MLVGGERDLVAGSGRGARISMIRATSSDGGGANKVEQARYQIVNAAPDV